MNTVGIVLGLLGVSLVLTAIHFVLSDIRSHLAAIADRMNRID